MTSHSLKKPLMATSGVGSERAGLIGWSLLVVALFLLSALATQYAVLAYALTGLELAYVLVRLACRDLRGAFLAHLVFMTTSYEVDSFVYGQDAAQAVISYASVPYIGLMAPLLVNLAIYGACRFCTRSPFQRISGSMATLNKWLNVLLWSGFALQLVSLLLNDNGVLELAWYPRQALAVTAKSLISLVALKSALFFLKTDPRFAERLTRLLTALLIGSCWSAALITLLGFRGFYGTSTQDIILMPLVHLFSVCVVCFAFYREAKHRTIYVASSVIAFLALALCASPLSGKWLIVVIATIVLLIVVCTDGRRLGMTLAAPFVFVFLLVLVFPTVQSSENLLFSYKFEQIMGLVDAGRLSDSDTSANMRFDELENTALEHCLKPGYAIAGKGFSGTTSHHTARTWDIDGAFSVEQRSADVYLTFHESANLLFARNGLIGLAFFVWVLFAAVKNVRKSPWLFVGALWFAFFFYLYPSIALFGACSLALGFFEVDQQNGLLGDGVSDAD